MTMRNVLFRRLFTTCRLQANPLKGRHVLSTKDLSLDDISHVLNVAELCKRMVKLQGGTNWCRHRTVAMCFFEPSTRTKSSFTAAIQRLGGHALDFVETLSSSKKGETMADTVRALESYSDVLVMRHPVSGTPKVASEYVGIPVINAGDGSAEHPTQTLLDLFTIQNELGLKSIQDFRSVEITLLGDLKYGRTVHSMMRVLGMLGMKVNLVSPKPVSMPEQYISEAKSLGGRITVQSDLQHVLRTTDVLYVTRIQQERFETEADYLAVKGQFVVTPELLQSAKSKMAVMHPLPRVDEIVPAVDNDPRAAYFRQMENGMYVRMAILASVMGRI